MTFLISLKWEEDRAKRNRDNNPDNLRKRKDKTRTIRTGSKATKTSLTATKNS